MQKEVMPPDSDTIPAPTFLESHQDTLWIYQEIYSYFPWFSLVFGKDSILYSHIKNNKKTDVSVSGLFNNTTLVT